MRIICPHCTTTYAIDLATLGAAGRTVRCSRCKEVWLARPEDAVNIQALAPAMADGGDPVAIVESEGLGAVGGADSLAPIVGAALEANPAVAEKLRGGDMKPIGVIVGFVMRETKGRADGGEVTRIVREKLEL